MSCFIDHFAARVAVSQLLLQLLVAGAEHALLLFDSAAHACNIGLVSRSAIVVLSQILGCSEVFDETLHSK